jgi:hypothetical protein
MSACVRCVRVCVCEWRGEFNRVVLVVQLGLIVHFILNPEQRRVFQLVHNTVVLKPRVYIVFRFGYGSSQTRNKVTYRRKYLTLWTDDKDHWCDFVDMAKNPWVL